MEPLRHNHRKLVRKRFFFHRFRFSARDQSRPCIALPSYFFYQITTVLDSNRANFMVKPFDRLVLVSSTRYRASTPSLSPGGLPGVLSFSQMGISYLEAGFALICFQRLSRPNLAIQLCRWRDNWCTRGSSIPVLSY